MQVKFTQQKSASQQHDVGDCRKFQIQDIQKQVHKEILDRLMFFLMDGVTNGPCPVGGSGFQLTNGCAG